MKKLKLNKIDFLDFIFAFITIFLSQRYNSSIIMLVIGIIYMLHAFFSPVEKVIYILALLIPSAENLSFYNSLTIPTAMVVIYLIRSFITLMKSERVKIHVWCIMSFLLMFYTIISSFFLDTFEPLSTTIKNICFLSLIASMFKEIEQKNKSISDFFVNFFRYVGIGIIIASISTVITGSNNNVFGRFSFGENSTINVIGIQCAIVIVAIVYSFIVKATNKISDLLIGAFCILISLFSMSRTSILMIAIGLILLTIFTLIKGGNKRMAMVILLLTIISVSLYTFNSDVHVYVEKTLTRFSADDISNGRYSLWQQTIDKMISNNKYMFIGAGNHSKIGAVYGKNNSVLVAHNFLIETWVIYGIIGLLILSLQFYYFIKENIPFYKYNKLLNHNNLISYVLIIVFISGFYYSHHFIGRCNSLLFIMSFIPIIMQQEIYENGLKEVKK